MSGEVPHPFGGWLEEHPDGGFLLLHKDGSRSPALRSYDAVRSYLARVELGEFAEIEDVIRVRHIFSDKRVDLDHIAKLYVDRKGRLGH